MEIRSTIRHTLINLDADQIHRRVIGKLHAVNDERPIFWKRLLIQKPEQFGLNLLAVATGCMALGRELLWEAIQLPLSAVTLSIGAVRILTWSEFAEDAYHFLPGLSDLLHTAKRVAAQAIGIFCSLLGAIFTFHKGAIYNVDQQERLGNFSCPSLDPIPRPQPARVNSGIGAPAKPLPPDLPPPNPPPDAPPPPPPSDPPPPPENPPPADLIESIDPRAAEPEVADRDPDPEPSAASLPPVPPPLLPLTLPKIPGLLRGCSASSLRAFSQEEAAAACDHLKGRMATIQGSRSIAQQYPTKNREGDMLPYDRTLWKLGDSEEGSSFYLNASVMESSTHRYVAAQWPMKETLFDFFRAIASTQTAVIVTLSTAINPYIDWWDLLTGVDGVGIERTKKPKDLGGIVERSLTIRESQKAPRQVAHFDYHGFESEPTPERLNQLLDLIDREKPGIRPILVLCNQGGKLSGTLIAAHMLKQRRLAKERVCIGETYLELAKQRPGMLQEGWQLQVVCNALMQQVREVGWPTWAAHKMESSVKPVTFLYQSVMQNAPAYAGVVASAYSGTQQGYQYLKAACTPFYNLWTYIHSLIPGATLPISRSYEVVSPLNRSISGLNFRRTCGIYA